MTPRGITSTEFTVFRPLTSGVYDERGRWVEDTSTTTFMGVGSIQPYQFGKTRKVLPEGVRADSCFIIYTETYLFTSDHIAETISDIIMIGNELFEVCYFEDWSLNTAFASTTDHYKIIVKRKDDNPNQTYGGA